MEDEKYYLSNLCHELNTTMNAFSYLVDQLEHSELEQYQLKMVHALRGATKSMKGFIQEIGTGKNHSSQFLSLHETAIEPFFLLDDMCELFRYQAENKGLHLNIHSKKNNSVNILADEIKLSHVFMNIISNAIKYTHQGSIHVHLEQYSISPFVEKLIFTCIDTGMGISMETISNLHERGYRQSNVIDEGISGEGIGFSIVQQLVDLMNGDISIQSEIGVGTNIQITFLFERVSEDASVDYIYDMKDADNLSNKKVLIVDDNQINLLLLKSLLERNGCIVDECDSGPQALKVVEDTSFDLILLDIQMPSMSGILVLYEILYHMKKNIPVVAITAEICEYEFARYKLFGFVDVISKPIDESGLIKRLGDIFLHSGSSGVSSSVDSAIIDDRLYEMASGDQLRFQDLKNHLKEELTFAIEGWGMSVQNMNWIQAKNILHREKVLLETLGVQEYDYMIQEILIRDVKFTDEELTLMYLSITVTFNEILKYISR